MNDFENIAQWWCASFFLDYVHGCVGKGVKDILVKRMMGWVVCSRRTTKMDGTCMLVACFVVELSWRNNQERIWKRRPGMRTRAWLNDGCESQWCIGGAQEVVDIHSAS